MIKKLEPPLLNRESTEGGQSLIELTLTLPLLLIILLGTIDLGRVFFAYVTITNASRVGARYGMTNFDSTLQTALQDPDPATQLQNIFQQNTLIESPGVLGTSTVLTECSPYDSSQPYSTTYCLSAQHGDLIRVTVTYTFQFETMYLFGLRNMAISNHTVMVIVH